MDTKKLLKVLSQGILVPHIENYLSAGNFPDKWVLEIQNKKEARDYGEATFRFSAREDTLLSAEKLYEKFTTPRKQQKISASLRKTFDYGSMLHAYYQAILLEMGFVEKENIERYIIKKIETKHGVAYSSGVGDLINVKIPGQGNWLIDLKSISSKKFDEGIDKYLMSQYVAQINLYGDWFECDKLMLLGLEKDSPHRLSEHIIPFNKDLVNHIYDKWTIVKHCLDNNIQIKDYPI